MKTLHPLTEEQRIFAEEHHDFIYQYLNGRHLGIEEYYDTYTLEASPFYRKI